MNADDGVPAHQRSFQASRCASSNSLSTPNRFSCTTKFRFKFTLHRFIGLKSSQRGKSAPFERKDQSDTLPFLGWLVGWWAVLSVFSHTGDQEARSHHHAYTRCDRVYSHRQGHTRATTRHTQPKSVSAFSFSVETQPHFERAELQPWVPATATRQRRTPKASVCEQQPDSSSVWSSGPVSSRPLVSLRRYD